MNISATIKSTSDRHETMVATNGQQRAIAIPRKESAQGSSVNGGELLFLALATCYCNDIYREAAKMDIAVSSVEVEVVGEFGGPGEPVREVSYRTRVEADAPEVEIAALIAHTDTVAEIQNTVRSAIPVSLSGFETISTQPK